MGNSSRDLQSLTSYEIGKVKEKGVLAILLSAYLFLPVLHVFVLIFLHYVFSVAMLLLKKERSLAEMDTPNSLFNKKLLKMH